MQSLLAASFLFLVAVSLAPPLIAHGYLSYTVLGQYPDHMRVATSQQRVIDSEDEWKKFFRSVTGDIDPYPAVPSVDFKKQVVVVVSSGEKPSGGYTVMVAGVFEEERSITIQVVEGSPGSNCGVAGALTYPTVVVMTPRINKPFRFHVSQVTLECAP